MTIRYICKCGKENIKKVRYSDLEDIYIDTTHKRGYFAFMGCGSCGEMHAIELIARLDTIWQSKKVDIDIIPVDDREVADEKL